MSEHTRAMHHRITPARSRIASCLRAGMPVCLVLALACSDNGRPTARERQEALLRDPFGYKSDDDHDISGGPIHKLNRDAIRKDLGNVLNP